MKLEGHWAETRQDGTIAGLPVLVCTSANREAWLLSFVAMSMG